MLRSLASASQENADSRSLKGVFPRSDSSLTPHPGHALTISSDSSVNARLKGSLHCWHLNVIGIASSSIRLSP